MVSFVFDSVFYGNYNHWLGFGEYLMSSGHQTPGAPAGGRSFYFGDMCPFQTDEDFVKHACNDTDLKPGDFKYPLYPKKVQQTWKTCNEHLQTRQCDTKVNIQALKSHLDKLFIHSLCRAGAEDKKLDKVPLYTDHLTLAPSTMGGWYVNLTTCDSIEGDAQAKVKCQQEKKGMGLVGGQGDGVTRNYTSMPSITPAAAPTTPSVLTANLTM